MAKEALDYYDLGRKLREYRRIRGMTQQELGDKARIDRIRIGRIECGHHQNIGIASLLRIAYGLGIEPSALMPKLSEMRHRPRDTWWWKAVRKGEK